MLKAKHARKMAHEAKKKSKKTPEELAKQRADTLESLEQVFTDIRSAAELGDCSVNVGLLNFAQTDLLEELGYKLYRSECQLGIYSVSW